MPAFSRLNEWMSSPNFTVGSGGLKPRTQADDQKAPSTLHSESLRRVPFAAVGRISVTMTSADLDTVERRRFLHGGETGITRVMGVSKFFQEAIRDV